MHVCVCVLYYICSVVVKVVLIKHNHYDGAERVVLVCKIVALCACTFLRTYLYVSKYIASRVGNGNRQSVNLKSLKMRNRCQNRD